MPPIWTRRSRCCGSAARNSACLPPSAPRSSGPSLVALGLTRPAPPRPITLLKRQALALGVQILLTVLTLL
jgi:hypothetical protein